MPQDPAQRKVAHFRVKPAAYQDTVNFMRHVERLPRGLTLGTCSDLLNNLMRSEPVLELKPAAPKTPKKDPPEGKGKIVETGTPENDERNPAEGNDELPPPKLETKPEEGAQ